MFSVRNKKNPSVIVKYSSYLELWESVPSYLKLMLYLVNFRMTLETSLKYVLHVKSHQKQTSLKDLYTGCVTH